EARRDKSARAGRSHEARSVQPLIGAQQPRRITMTENSLPSPAVLQRYLHGVDYPATKDQLVAHVRTQCEHATGDAQSECERVIGTLTRLPNQQYSRPTDVSKAFGEIARETLRGADYP